VKNAYRTRRADTKDKGALTIFPGIVYWKRPRNEKKERGWGKEDLERGDCPIRRKIGKLLSPRPLDFKTTDFDREGRV